MLVRETNLSNIQRAIYNLEKGNYMYPVSCDSETFSCEEDLHRDEKEISTRRDFFYSIGSEEKSQSISCGGGSSEQEYLLGLFELFFLDYLYLRMAYR